MLAFVKCGNEQRQIEVGVKADIEPDNLLLLSSLDPGRLEFIDFQRLLHHRR